MSKDKNDRLSVKKVIRKIVVEDKVESEKETSATKKLPEAREKPKAKARKLSIEDDEIDDPDFYCKECSRRFYDDTLYFAHCHPHGLVNDSGCEACCMKCPHVHCTDDKSVCKCAMCGQEFKMNNFRKLENHVLRHMNMRTYSCDECRKTYNTRTDMRRHKVLTHSDPGGCD